MQQTIPQQAAGMEQEERSPRKPKPPVRESPGIPERSLSHFPNRFLFTIDFARLFSFCPVPPPVDAPAAITSRISLTYLNTEANNYSYAPAMRPTAVCCFRVHGDQYDLGLSFHWHIYRRDLSRTTELVSVKNDGATGVMASRKGRSAATDGSSPLRWYDAFVAGDTNGRKESTSGSPDTIHDPGQSPPGGAVRRG
jgi:hypothetical protein